MRALLLIVAIGLTGCTTMKFRHPSKGGQELNRDWTDCQAKMGQSGVSGLIRQRYFMRDCMNGQGWEEE